MSELLITSRHIITVKINRYSEGLASTPNWVELAPVTPLYTEAMPTTFLGGRVAQSRIDED
jgi:hypothetical protein